MLTGFMGTGKTTVGRLVAERLGFEFVDTDAVIEAEYGPIPGIFARHGEAFFRDLEADLAADLAERGGLVVATGGGLMLREANRTTLGRGRVVCLTATVDEIVRRVVADGTADRPLLAGDDPAGRVRALLAERVEGYAAFAQVDTTGRTPQEVGDAVVAAIGGLGAG